MESGPGGLACWSSETLDSVCVGRPYPSDQEEIGCAGRHNGQYRVINNPSRLRRWWRHLLTSMTGQDVFDPDGIGADHKLLDLVDVERPDEGVVIVQDRPRRLWVSRSSPRHPQKSTPDSVQISVTPSAQPRSRPGSGYSQRGATSGAWRGGHGLGLGRSGRKTPHDLSPRSSE